MPDYEQLDFSDTLRELRCGDLMFGRYRLLQYLGRGGMGVVWRANDEELDFELAMKFLPFPVCSDEDSVRSLKEETKRCLVLHHPHIVKVFGFTSNGLQAAITMEFIAGENLNDLKRIAPGGCFASEEIEGMMCQLLDALHYAHARVRMVHRDLKPGNLRVTLESELKVMDFGTARTLADSVTRTTGRRPPTGTLAYMSPEQLMGGLPNVLDDIYAIGASIYDLLTGRPPFFTGDITAQIREVMPPWMGRRRTENGKSGPPIPEQWEKVVAACLAKSAKDRPQSVAEVAGALGLPLAGVGLAPAGPSASGLRTGAVQTPPAAVVPVKADAGRGAAQASAPALAAGGKVVGRQPPGAKAAGAPGGVADDRDAGESQTRRIPLPSRAKEKAQEAEKPKPKEVPTPVVTPPVGMAVPPVREPALNPQPAPPPPPAAHQTPAAPSPPTPAATAPPSSGQGSSPASPPPVVGQRVVPAPAPKAAPKSAPSTAAPSPPAGQRPMPSPSGSPRAQPSVWRVPHGRAQEIVRRLLEAPGRWLARRQKLVAMSAAGLLVLVGGGTWVYQSWHGDGEVPQPPKQEEPSSPPEVGPVAPPTQTPEPGQGVGMQETAPETATAQKEAASPPEPPPVAPPPTKPITVPMAEPPKPIAITPEVQPETRTADTGMGGFGLLEPSSLPPGGHLSLEPLGPKKSPAGGTASGGGVGEGVSVEREPQVIVGPAGIDPAIVAELGDASDFAREFFLAPNSDPLGQLKYYAPQVVHFDHGKKGTDFIADDLRAYHSTWPDQEWSVEDLMVWRMAPWLYAADATVGFVHRNSYRKHEGESRTHVRFNKDLGQGQWRIDAIGRIDGDQKVPAFDMGETRQVIAGVSRGWDDSHAVLRRWSRVDKGWVAEGDAWSARLGRAGLGWGIGRHPPNPPKMKGPDKREGDGRSPAGIFEMGESMGYAPELLGGLRWPYLYMEGRDLWITDSTRRGYNRHVVVEEGRDLSEEEKRFRMSTDDPRLRLKVILKHNYGEQTIPYGGSSIFLQIWLLGDKGSEPTVGSVSMPEENLDALLRWLDPDAKPLFVLLPREVYDVVRAKWQLPPRPGG